MRVDSITSAQANLTGSFSGSFVGSLDLTGSVGLADTASYVALAGVDGSGSIASRLTSQEDFSSSLDATFATEAELDAATGSLVKNVTPSSTTATISILNGDGSNAVKTIYSSSFAIKANSVRRALSQGSGIETFSYDGGSVQSVQLNTSSAHFTTGAKSAAGSASFSTRVTNLEDFSSSLDATFATDSELSALSSSASTSRNQLATDYQSADTTLSSSLASDISTNTDNISSNSSSAATSITNLSSSASTSRDALATDIATNASDISTLNGKTLFSGSAQVSLGGDLSGTANNATVAKVQGVALTSGEATQLANINSSTISATQWGYVGALDQGLTTTSNITSSNLLVSNNLVVNGTASFAILQSITGSAKIIGDAYIILNNNTPAERYAGVKVYDSGSAGVTASLEFDGQTNDWFYEYSDDGGATTDHGAVIFGPEYNTKGSPTYPTSNTLVKGNGDHHIVDSNITDNGSLITLGSNTSITGTIVASGTPLVSGSGQIVLESADKTGFTGASSITTLGTIGTGVWQGTSISTTYTDAKVTSINAGGGIDVSATTGAVTVSAEAASTTNAGVVELATTAETTTGTDTTKAVTPDGLKDGYQGSTNVGTLGTISTGVWQGSSISTTYTDAKITAITAGTLIDTSGTGNITVNVDLSELSTSTSDGDGDYFVVVDTGNAQKKLTKANINLSGFNNDLGITSLTAQTASVDTTMVASKAYVVTGTASPITMSLPASPSNGDLIKFANMDDRATLLARNGNNIMGLAEDMTLNVEQVSFDLVYVGPTAGWTIYGSRALS
jgi:hypothetical protein